jgi:hypothetical protein
MTDSFYILPNPPSYVSTPSSLDTESLVKEVMKRKNKVLITQISDQAQLVLA